MATLRLLPKHLLLKRITKDIGNTPAVSLTNARFLNYAPKEYTEENDPSKHFFNNEIQSLLKTLTRINLETVFYRRKTGERLLSLPNFKFITEDQLQEAIKDATQKAEELLQMPPALKIRKPIDSVLSKDYALKGLDECKIVFTDITYGIKDSERLIVVREPDGTLRHANWDIRERMNQVYFPLLGKKYKIPKMFEDIYLESLLQRKEYKFILDRTCLQFEPNSTEYQRIASITYQYLNDNNDFEHLRSTRHFGSLCFFLVWHRTIDNLLLELIQTQNIVEANLLLKLYSQIHSMAIDFKDVNDTASIEHYINKHSQKKALLELAIQNYKELERERIDLESGIKKAHGTV